MRSESGYLLLEVLVAFIIGALALSVLFDGSLAGLRSTQIAENYQQAVARARSHLAAMDSRVTKLAATEQQGDDGSGFHWQTRIVPIATSVAGSGTASALANKTAIPETLYRVSVTISWRQDGRRRSLTLESERIAIEMPR